MLEVGVVAGIVATVLLVILAYYVAIGTYRLGLDPDNHGVPVVTSASDLDRHGRAQHRPCRLRTRLTYPERTFAHG